MVGVVCVLDPYKAQKEIEGMGWKLLAQQAVLSTIEPVNGTIEKNIVVDGAWLLK